MQLDPKRLCTTASLATAILLAAPPAHAQQATSDKRLADVTPQGQASAAAVLGGGVGYAVPDARAAAEAAAELGEACTTVINIQVQVEELAAKRKASLAVLAAASKEFRAQVRVVLDAEKELKRTRTTWGDSASALPPPTQAYERATAQAKTVEAEIQALRATETQLAELMTQAEAALADCQRADHELQWIAKRGKLLLGIARQKRVKAKAQARVPTQQAAAAARTKQEREIDVIRSESEKASAVLRAFMTHDR